MTTPTLSEPVQIIHQQASREKRKVWGPWVLIALVPVFLAVWFVVNATFSVESRIDKVEAYLHAIESDPYHQAINTRHEFLAPCEEVADLVYCSIREESTLFSRAGFAPEYKMTFLFNEDNQINMVGRSHYSPDSDPVLFQPQYCEWLEATHPDEYRQLPKNWGTGLAEVEETAQVLLAHIDEFLAQSDEYPRH
jgi:hypothetical protein